MSKYQPKPGELCKFKLVKNPKLGQPGTSDKAPAYVNPMREKPNKNGKLSPAHFTINDEWYEAFAYVNDGVMSVTIKKTQSNTRPQGNKNFGRNTQKDNWDNADDFLG